MRYDARRARSLDRIVRFRQIEQIQALEAVSKASAEANRIDQLHKRSRDMLASETSSEHAIIGGGLTNSLAYRSQLARLAASTDSLRSDAQKRLRQAQVRLRETERRLEVVEDRATANARAKGRKSHEGSAAQAKVARRLLNHNQNLNEQGRRT